MFDERGKFGTGDNRRSAAERAWSREIEADALLDLGSGVGAIDCTPEDKLFDTVEKERFLKSLNSSRQRRLEAAMLELSLPPILRNHHLYNETN